ncbi:hypothetical protein HK405_015919, partial [Cladochytrium tenue]
RSFFYTPKNGQHHNSSTTPHPLATIMFRARYAPAPVRLLLVLLLVLQLVAARPGRVKLLLPG